jgi:hypothetical protein
MFFLLGLIIMPNNAFACGKTNKARKENNCCKKNKADNKDCCKKSKKDNKGCAGKCGEKSCKTPVPSFAFQNKCILDFENKSFNNHFEKQVFFYQKTSISSGFLSIWLIPKIS